MAIRHTRRGVRWLAWALGLLSAATGGGAGAAADDPQADRPQMAATPERTAADCSPPPALLLGPPEEPKDTGDAEEENDGGPTGLRKLTREEVNRIRYLELRGMRLGQATNRPDRVIVRIPKETTEAFLKEMEGHEDWQGEATRREFHRLTAPQKLHQIAIYCGARYADRVRIMSDPEVFVAFRQNVMPTAVRACAQPGCHLYDPQHPRPFQLFNDPVRSEATTYANFVMLCEMEIDGRRVINRAKPEESLLLTYLLPVKDVEPALRHAGDPGPKTIFRTRKAIGYRAILRWISLLKHPAEDYGVRFNPPPPLPPADDDHADDARPPEKPRENGAGPTSGPAGGPGTAGAGDGQP